MINYINRDITTIDRGVIAHGVNCQGVMGSGVARALRDKWPIVYEDYKICPTGRQMLGRAYKVEIVPDQLYVANCYTQVFYGYNGRFADVDAIESALWYAYEWADFHHLDVYMPKIGAGRGGLDWDKEIVPVIEYINSKWIRTDTFVCLWRE